jgi:hypothetical protein
MREGRVSQKSNGNAGYRLGLVIRRVRVWDARLADAAQRRGIPHRVAKIPALLILVVIAGLLLAGAVFLAGFIMLVLLAGVYCASALAAKYDSDDYPEGYHAMGPEGPGMYRAGRKISDNDNL